ncbi:hypothetical protein KR054_001387, partial [Drosophila jambulina]
DIKSLKQPFIFQIMDLNGFDRGLEAEKVITVVDHAGKTLICVKFKGQPRPELIPSDVANLKISRMIIEFYEANLRYDLPDQEEEVELKGNKRGISVKGKAESNS